jgi:hypothetical protein
MVAFKVDVPKAVEHIPNIQELFDAIQVAKEAKDPYAQAYLDALDRSIEEGGVRGLRSQLLYVACNLNYWRGENARETKKIFKKWDKILDKYSE